MIKRLLHIVFNLFIILVISCGFTVFKCVKLVNEHKYHHVNNCRKDNSLLLDCFNNCNGFQPFAEEHQHDDNTIDVSLQDYLFPENSNLTSFVSELYIRLSSFIPVNHQQVLHYLFRPPLV